MELNRFGEIARQEWLRTADLRENVELDEFCIMPNHLHGVILLEQSNTGTARRAHTEKFGKPTKSSLPTIIRSYKSAVTRRIHLVKPDMGKFWTRNYYEHVVRSSASLDRIREYIMSNQENWNKDFCNQY